MVKEKLFKLYKFLIKLSYYIVLFTETKLFKFLKAMIIFIIIVVFCKLILIPFGVSFDTSLIHLIKTKGLIYFKNIIKILIREDLLVSAISITGAMIGGFAVWYQVNQQRKIKVLEQLYLSRVNTIKELHKAIEDITYMENYDIDILSCNRLKTIDISIPYMPKEFYHVQNLKKYRESLMKFINNTLLDYKSVSLLHLYTSFLDNFIYLYNSYDCLDKFPYLKVIFYNDARVISRMLIRHISKTLEKNKFSKLKTYPNKFNISKHYILFYYLSIKLDTQKYKDFLEEKETSSTKKILESIEKCKGCEQNCIFNIKQKKSSSKK